MVIALSVVGGVIVLVLAVLASPVDVDFHVDTDAAHKARARLGLFYGLVHVDLGAPAPPHPHRAPRARKARRDWAGRGLRFATTPGLGRRVLRLARRSVRALHVRDVAVTAALGLDDPVDTALLWGVVGPFALLATSRFPRVRVVPDFVEPSLRVRGGGTLFVVPLELAAIALAFVTSPAMMRAWARSRRT